MTVFESQVSVPTRFVRNVYVIPCDESLMQHRRSLYHSPETGNCDVGKNTRVTFCARSSVPEKRRRKTSPINPVSRHTAKLNTSRYVITEYLATCASACETSVAGSIETITAEFESDFSAMTYDCSVPNSRPQPVLIPAWISARNAGDSNNFIVVQSQDTLGRQ